MLIALGEIGNELVIMKYCFVWEEHEEKRISDYAQ